MYCGIEKVPKGKERGTIEFCAKKKQIRYYGLKKINKDQLLKKNNKNDERVKESLKYNKLNDDAKVLVKDYKNLKVKYEINPLKTTKKKIDDLLKKRDKLLIKIKKQKKVVKKLNKE